MVWAEVEEAGDGVVLRTVLLHPHQEVEAAFGGLSSHFFHKTRAPGLGSGIHASHCVDPHLDLWEVGLATTPEETWCTPYKNLNIWKQWWKLREIYRLRSTCSSRRWPAY